MNLEPTVQDLLQRRIDELGRRDFGWIAEAIEGERGGAHLKTRLFERIARMGANQKLSDDQLRRLLIAQQFVVGSLLTLPFIADPHGRRELRLTVAMRILRDIGHATDIVTSPTAVHRDVGGLIGRIIGLGPGGRWCVSVESDFIGRPDRVGAWFQPFVGKAPLTQGPLAQTNPFWIQNSR